MPGTHQVTPPKRPFFLNSCFPHYVRPSKNVPWAMLLGTWPTPPANGTGFSLTLPQLRFAVLANVSRNMQTAPTPLPQRIGLESGTLAIR